MMADAVGIVGIAGIHNEGEHALGGVKEFGDFRNVEAGLEFGPDIWS